MKHRCSLIATMAESPLAYHTRATSPFEQTPAMRFGSLVDAHVFGYELDHWKVHDVARRNGLGPNDVTREEWNAAKACADAVRRNPAAAEVLETGEAQFPLEWTEEGIRITGRPDFLSTATGYVVDLKTTSGGLSNHALASTVSKYRYHIQIALYQLGLAENGIDLNPAFLFVQSSPPYDCRVVDLGEEQASVARNAAKRLLHRIWECEAVGRWPGVSEEIATLTLPAYTWEET